jgi:hypothetical protein
MRIFYALFTQQEINLLTLLRLIFTQQVKPRPEGSERQSEPENMRRRYLQTPAPAHAALDAIAAKLAPNSKLIK